MVGGREGEIVHKQQGILYASILLCLLGFLICCSGGKGAAQSAKVFREGSEEDGGTPNSSVSQTKGQTGAPSSLEWVYSEPSGAYFTKTEVTVSQFQKCVEEGNCVVESEDLVAKMPKCNWNDSTRLDHPLNCISWFAASLFCQSLHGRLPTQKEWYLEASNCGKWRWPWGDEPEVSCDFAVWAKDSKSDGCGTGRTWPVCSKRAGDSVSGLCDMSGNVMEWTLSVFQPDSDGIVVRGGGWNSGSGDVVASSRLWSNSSFQKNMGFRCVRSPL